mmetsp:Transcript_3613/g.16571  ORF Transcript_3613/g.16571 Transcript_3613/m.16571 type:complete len:268 (-) Transcript_3613:1318-2121(-)
MTASLTDRTRAMMASRSFSTSLAPKMALNLSGCHRDMAFTIFFFRAAASSFRVRNTKLDGSGHGTSRSRMEPIAFNASYASTCLAYISSVAVASVIDPAFCRIFASAAACRCWCSRCDISSSWRRRSSSIISFCAFFVLARRASSSFCLRSASSRMDFSLACLASSSARLRSSSSLRVVAAGSSSSSGRSPVSSSGESSSLSAAAADSKSGCFVLCASSAEASSEASTSSSSSSSRMGLRRLGGWDLVLGAVCADAAPPVALVPPVP